MWAFRPWQKWIGGGKSCPGFFSITRLLRSFPPKSWNCGRSLGPYCFPTESAQEQEGFPLGLEDPLERDRPSTPVLLGSPGGSDSKESACNVPDLGLISGLGRSPGGRHGNPCQCSCLENLHGQRILAAYSPWGHTESNMAERLSTAHPFSSHISSFSFHIISL